MDIVITQWALDAYLNLRNVFTQKEFKNKIRPDVLLLRQYPNSPKFANGKFWSRVNDRSGSTITHGFKMKWHQIGNGREQLRLQVAIMLGKTFLCEGYIKSNDKFDKRMSAKFKTYIQLIQQGKHRERGLL